MDNTYSFNIKGQGIKENIYSQETHDPETIYEI